MMQRWVKPAAGAAVQAWDGVQVGVSRLALEALAAWGRLRAGLPAAARGWRPRPRPLPTIGGRMAFSALSRIRARAAATPLPAAHRPAAVSSPAVFPVSPVPAPAARGPALLALDAALFISTAFVVILIHRDICELMREIPEYRARVEDLRLVQRPDWAPGETVTIALPMDAALEAQARGYAPGLVAEVGRRFERNPWVRRVLEVRRSYPSGIEVRLELRRPAARVLAGNRGILVDEDGVRLPDLRNGTPLPAGCYEITGVGGAVPAVGARWSHPGVQGALDVVHALDRYEVPRVLFIAQIDVSNMGGRRDRRESEILMRTAAGTWVAWGRPPSTREYGENNVDVKMKHLALALESYPGLLGLERCDLRFDRVVVQPRPERRGLAAADVPGRTRR